MIAEPERHALDAIQKIDRECMEKAVQQLDSAWDLIQPGKRLYDRRAEKSGHQRYSVVGQRGRVVFLVQFAATWGTLRAPSAMGYAINIWTRNGWSAFVAHTRLTPESLADMALRSNLLEELPALIAALDFMEQAL